MREQDFKDALRVALNDASLQAVLVLFDSDNDCARNIVPSLLQWAKEEAGHRPCAVVLARREYEAWFLAGIESLQGVRGVRADAAYPQNPEATRGAKEALRKLMPKNRPYDETADQSALSARLDLGMAYRRASSFRKLVKEVCRLLVELGHQPIVPQNWRE